MRIVVWEIMRSIVFKSTLLSTSLIFLLALCFLLDCASDGWLDDGQKYLCSECKNVYASELAPCVHCSVNSTPYQYCYDCAKELNLCQLCGKERWFLLGLISVLETHKSCVIEKVIKLRWRRALYARRLTLHARSWFLNLQSQIHILQCPFRSLQPQACFQCNVSPAQRVSSINVIHVSSTNMNGVFSSTCIQPACPLLPS